MEKFRVKYNIESNKKIKRFELWKKVDLLQIRFMEKSRMR